jgi:hypothetical protein
MKRFPNACQQSLGVGLGSLCGHGDRAVPPASESWVGVRRGQRRSSCDGHLRCSSGGRSTLTSSSAPTRWRRSEERPEVAARVSGSASLGTWPRCAPEPQPGHDQERCIRP